MDETLIVDPFATSATGSATSQPAASESPATRQVAPERERTCALATVCPDCGVEMNPEHAHYRCPSCGYRDSCCF